VHCATFYNRPDAIELFVKKGGALLKMTSEQGFEALHLGAYLGKTDSVKKLIELGANIEAEDQSGKTPLYLAVEKGSYASAQVLIDSKASIEGCKDNKKCRKFCTDYIRASAQS
jgi:ankyrin repeat protein